MEKNRVKAEQDLLDFGTKSSILIKYLDYLEYMEIIKMLLIKLYLKVKPIYKEGHYFNRIHEKDIARSSLGIVNQMILEL